MFYIIKKITLEIKRDYLTFLPFFFLPFFVFDVLFIVEILKNKSTNDCRDPAVDYVRNQIAVAFFFVVVLFIII